MEEPEPEGILRLKGQQQFGPALRPWPHPALLDCTSGGAVNVSLLRSSRAPRAGGTGASDQLTNGCV